ncbi:MAG: carboxymuconolactone decarboxylase family protein [Methanomassiliicoccales archaeon]|nr:carboxymuconolactone decarboxylase family protein [Methanomassiliicoccales archaeon]
MSLEELAKHEPPTVNALYRYKHEIFKDAALSIREKELIAVSLSCVLKCETCLEVHARDALKNGATKEQLREAMMVALYMSGPTSIVWSPVIDDLMK